MGACSAAEKSWKKQPTTLSGLKRFGRYRVTAEDLSLSPTELARPHIGTNWGTKEMAEPGNAVKAVRILLTLGNITDLKRILESWLYKDPRCYNRETTPFGLVPGTEKAVAIALRVIERTDAQWVDRYNAKQKFGA